MFRKINQKTKQLKTIILRIVQECIEPFLWEEFTESLVQDGRGNYKIHDNDLPVVRDLKAFINMFTAVERSTESYSLYAASFFMKLELPQNYFEFRQNYKLFMSTNTILTFYLVNAKEYVYKTLFPALYEKFNELYELCTSANLQKGAEFFIEQIITLEQYQQKYEMNKRLKEKNPDEKSEPGESIFAVLVKKNDFLLRKFYQDKYELYFKTDKDKKDEKQLIEKSWDYYPENIKDKETLKNIKKLSNGIIGIKKVLDDYYEYQKAGTMSSLSWVGTFIIDIRKAYNYLQEFEYQAIIAEQGKPLAEYIKAQLKELNGVFEKLAILADQYEYESCLKETILLKNIDILVKRYNQITEELKIPTDYRIQKRVYCKARISAREKYLVDIDQQILDLAIILMYKENPISGIPNTIRLQIQKFIDKYENDISMDRDNLAKYKKYLTQVPLKSSGIWASIAAQLESVGNSLGLTIHYEFMTSLYKRKLYLKKQKNFLQTRLGQLKQYSQDNPYDYFVPAEIKSVGYSKVVQEALKKQVNRLTVEKEQFIRSLASTNDDALIKSKDAKQVVGMLALSIKKLRLTDVKPRPKEMSDRTANRVTAKIQELNTLNTALQQLEKSNDIDQFLICMRKEECLSSKTSMLLDEIEEIKGVKSLQP